jgi:flagellar hook assembly protein FlgD
MSEMVTSVESTQFDIPKASIVTLKVYNILGQEVATLVNGVEEPGYKSVSWDARRVPSGVYFYRIQAGNYLKTKKLLLLR